MKHWPVEKLSKSSADDDPAVVAASDAVDDLDWELVMNATQDQLDVIFQDGTRQAMAVLGIDEKDITADVFDASAQYAQDRAAELIGMRYNAKGALVPNANARWAITDSTRDFVRTSVANAIETGLPASELADTLADSMAFSPARAMMIARTEIIRSNNQAHLATFKASGVVESKAWSTADDDEVDEDVCQPNEDQGPIPLDDDFESGDDAPPGHPNCRCVLIPVTSDASESDDSEEDDEGDEE